MPKLKKAKLTLPVKTALLGEPPEESEAAGEALPVAVEEGDEAGASAPPPEPGEPPTAEAAEDPADALAVVTGEEEKPAVPMMVVHVGRAAWCLPVSRATDTLLPVLWELSQVKLGVQHRHTLTGAQSQELHELLEDPEFHILP